MKTTFPSINRSNEVRYAFDSEGRWRDGRYRNDVPLDALGEYYTEAVTLGDGMVAHAPDYYTRKEHFGDYCASLAVYLLKVTVGSEQQKELWDTLKFKFPHVGIAARDLEFFTALRYNESKTRYYNRQERKESTASAKQYDKRWSVIESWATGGVIATLRLMGRENCDLLEKYALCRRIYEYLLEHDGWDNEPAQLLGLCDELTERYWRVQCPFESVCAVLRSWAAYEQATKQVANFTEAYQRNVTENHEKQSA